MAEMAWQLFSPLSPATFWGPKVASPMGLFGAFRSWDQLASLLGRIDVLHAPHAPTPFSAFLGTFLVVPVVVAYSELNLCMMFSYWDTGVPCVKLGIETELPSSAAPLRIFRIAFSRSKFLTRRF